MKQFAILDFDLNKGMIEPSDIIQKREDMPKYIILTFFHDVVTTLLEHDKIFLITNMKSEMGNHPVYQFHDAPIGIAPMPVGGPLAAGGILEELIALGGEYFLACGGAGVLVNHPVGSIIVPNEAIRGEGLSYHYVKPSYTIKQDDQVIKEMTSFLSHKKISYSVGKIWTTDAFYRETKSKIEKYKAEGVIAVDMEFASFLAVSQFRKVVFSQILYAGDSLANENWDSRGWNNRLKIRESIVDLCKEYFINML